MFVKSFFKLRWTINTKDCDHYYGKNIFEGYYRDKACYNNKLFEEPAAKISI